MRRIITTSLKTLLLPVILSCHHVQVLLALATLVSGSLYKIPKQVRNDSIRAKKSPLFKGDSLLGSNANASLKLPSLRMNILSRNLLTVNLKAVSHSVEPRGIAPLPPDFVDLVPHWRGPTPERTVQ